jgi:hypothetical protein
VVHSAGEQPLEVEGLVVTTGPYQRPDVIPG